MSNRAIFAIEVAIVALAFAVHVARLSKKRLLSFKYTIGWMSVCLFGIFASPLVFLITPLAKWLRLTPTALLIAMSTISVAVILIQLSVSISGNQRKMETLVRENALLRESLGISMKDKQSDHSK
ncbi:MAG: DUF2304 domain-containing protein [Actinobacteria bacterium]|nr:DUF2304 domain-containing protein [Actinomycetota bacterium]